LYNLKVTIKILTYHYSGLHLRDGGEERNEVFLEKRSRSNSGRSLQADAGLGPDAAPLQPARSQNVFAGQGKQNIEERHK
jgi:hypothetical protein